MADRKLIVRVIGDASSYTNTLNQATAATKAFGQQMSTATAGRTPLDQFTNIDRVKAGLQDLRITQARLAESALREADAQTKADQTRGRSVKSLVGIGAASVIAFNALQHLRDGLTVTGDAAFTTEGKVRNLAAALLSGDLIGGLQALSAQEARLAPDLEKAVALLKQMGDEASRIDLKDVIGDTAKFHAAADQMTKDLVSIGIPIDQAKEKTAAWVQQLQKAAGTTLDLGSTVSTVFGNIFTQLDELTKKTIAARRDALSGLSQLPPGIGAAIAREEGPEGSEAGLLKVLRQADANLLKKIEELRKGSGRDVSEALKRAQEQRNSINAQIKALLAPPPPGAIPTVSTSGTDKQADAIRRERERLKRVKEEAARLAAEQREFAKQLEQQRQFRALGLTAEGEKLTPTVANLQKQLKSLTSRIAGTRLDTGANKALLKKIRNVLNLDGVTEDTRKKINELFETIRSGFEEGAAKVASGPLTKTSGLNTKKILEGLGLDQAQTAELRSRLSGFNTAGRALAPTTAPTTSTAGAFGQPIVVQSTTNLILDGAVIARAVTRNQQKNRRRNPPQKRGPNRIGGV